MVERKTLVELLALPLSMGSRFAWLLLQAEEPREVDELARELCCTRREANRRVAELREAGLVERRSGFFGTRYLHGFRAKPLAAARDQTVPSARSSPGPNGPAPAQDQTVPPARELAANEPTAEDIRAARISRRRRRRA